MVTYSFTAISQPFWLNDDPKLLRTFMVEFSKFDEIEEIIADLSLNVDLEYIERVPMDRIDWVPDDPLYHETVANRNWNWHLDVINAEAAWDIAQGNADVNVAVVDNAVWIEHEDLEDKISDSYYTSGGPGSNSNPPGTGSAEEWSHGTHCAGLVGAATDNGIGVASIGNQVMVIGVRASSVDPTNISGGYSGLQWAANNGADVISMSWGNTYYSTTNQNVVNAAHNNGVTMLASAGNDNVQTNHYPSGYNYVMCVVATDGDDKKANFSNYGVQADICAPGGTDVTGQYGLLSTYYADGNTSWDHYASAAGTSMACPFAAGLAGLVKSINPDLSPDQLEEVLKSTCVDIDNVPGNEAYAGKLGSGRIDAYQAVLNTPFEPTAAFYTPVPYIMPGTTIDFTDMSTGVPSDWTWEFNGGDPSISYDQNPSVYYDEEGVFTVILAVENDFGLDVITETGYIEVTSTPHPWTMFSADTNYVCSFEDVSFTDETLYGPTTWSWEIQPETFVFVNGTSAADQNPVVQFEKLGLYTITLSTTNANGSHSKTVDNMIYVEGLEMDFFDDFEDPESGNFRFISNTQSRITIDERASAPGGTLGLHFQGGTGATWQGTSTNTTPEQAWNENTSFQGFAENCSVDANNTNGVSLTLDLRQTFSLGPLYSWFRVLIDGEPVADEDGTINFNPSTNSDPFETKTFNLNAYANSSFSITLQSACNFPDLLFAEGDNVFVDNLMITATTGIDDGNPGQAGVLTYPNPAKDNLNISAHGIGDQFDLRIVNVQGQEVYSESVSNYQKGQNVQLNISSLAKGVYVLQLEGNANVVNKKIIIE